MHKILEMRNNHEIKKSMPKEISTANLKKTN